MIIMALLLCGTLASAQQKFVVARDNSNNFNDDERPNNRGLVDWLRGAKGPYAETYYCDWDTGPIQTWLDENPLGQDERYKFEFVIMPTSAWPDGDDPAGYEAQVWTMNLLYDWAEGDSTNPWDPYSWSPGVPAATDYYAQHVWKFDNFLVVDDLDNCVPWTDEDGTTYDRYYLADGLHKLQNSQNLWANVDLYFTYISVELDEEVWQDLVTNDLNRGLALNGGGGWANSTLYSIEQVNEDQVPHLLVSIVPDVVLPHPGDTQPDGMVDGADYTIWADNYGTTDAPLWSAGGWTVGNFTEDTNVDGADYTVWADNYGYGTGGAAVPEPATLLLLTAGGALAGLVRRRR
jgi:hypothetical protein